MASKGDESSLLESARQERLSYDGNSMWDWSSLHLSRLDNLSDLEYSKKSRADDPIAIDCWKYESEDITSGFTIAEDEVKYIKEDDIPAWLESPQNDRRPCAGLRLIHMFQSAGYISPFNPQTLAAINDKFGLPDVFSHVASSLTGAFGTFMSEDSGSGMSS